MILDDNYEINDENKNMNDIKTENIDVKIGNHKKCVPLEIYQKVFNDKQKLLIQLEEINNKLQANISDEKINMISALQNKLKIIEKSNKSLENILIKQEKSVINLKSKIAKYEKLINKKK